jgi:excisionase family DNA binding protein
MAMQVTMIESPVWTPAEAAPYLKVSINTVHELCRTGQLRARRVGRQWRILKSDLDVYLGVSDTGRSVKRR